MFLLVAFEHQKNELLCKLLQFAQFCAGQGRNISKLRNAAECEKEIEDELPLATRLSTDPCVRVVTLLSSFSSAIFPISFSSDTILEHLMFPATAEIVIVYRTALNSRRSDRSTVLTELNGLHLVTVMGGEHVTDTMCFRWSERFHFWKVDTNTRTQTSHPIANDKFSVPDWRILIYARCCKQSYIDEKLAMNLNGQRRMWCDIHRAFLVRQPLSCELPCCVKDCSRSARFACLGRGDPCPHSICKRHGDDLVAGDDVVHIAVDMPGCRLRPSRTAAGDQLTGDDDDLAGGIYHIWQQYDAGDDEVDMNDIDERVLAPIGIDDFPSDVGAPPTHSRRDIIPVFDVNHSVPSHLVWNNHYNVMRRGTRFSDVRSNGIIEHIVASTNSASVSLLYPEGQLFPRIFWCSKSGSVLGAIPSFMLNTSVRVSIWHGIHPQSPGYPYP